MPLTLNIISRSTFAAIFLFTAFFSAYSQKTVHIDGEKGVWMESIVGDQLLIASDKNLYAYSPSGELLWKKPFQESYNFISNLTITSPSALYTYKLSFKGDNLKTFNDKPARVTQIAKNGAVKNFELPAQKSYGKTLLTIFCDDQYLYYLTTAGGEEHHLSKRSQEKLLLNRFSPNDQSHQQFTLDAPPVPESNNDWVFWSYAGQVGELKYVMSKGWIVENESEKAIVELVGFTSNGEIKVRKTITTTLKDKFMRPVKMRQSGMSYITYEDQDFESVGPVANNQVVTMRPEAQTAGAFLGFQADPIHKCFYAYGLVGPKLFKRIAPEYDGFYIVKYDLEGNEVWRVQRTGDKELVDERIFHRGAAPAFRSLYLNSLADGRLNVFISWPKGSATFDISETGKVLNETSNSAAAKFVRSRTDKDKNISYGVFQLSKGEVVIRWNDKDPDRELIFFPRE